MARKEAFDAISGVLPGIWNVPGSIDLMDDLVDLWERAQGPEDSDDFKAAIVKHLRFEEGVRPRAYKDHLGYWTIGVGRLIDSVKGGRITAEEDAILMRNDPSRIGRPWRTYVLTDDEINMLLENDIERMTGAIRNWPAWRAVGDNVARKVALTSMAFQLGVSGLAEFVNTLGMVEKGWFSPAADNMLKSKWAKQTPERAERIAEMMRTGRIA